MASGEDERDHEWGDVAAVLEAMSGAVSQYRRRKHRAPRRRFAPAAPAPAPAPAPPQTGSLFPWQQPAAPAPAPAPSTYNMPTPAGPASSASPQEAQYRCPGATVVWVNERSRIYHFAGTRDYGHTKRGAYMCEADAQTAGNRAAKNESHP